MTSKAPTTAEPDVELDEQTAGDVARLKAITDQIADLTALEKELKVQLRLRLPLGKSYSFGGRRVLELGDPAAQFDAAIAATIIPRELIPAVSLLKLDATLAKKILPPAVYAACCKPKAAAVKPL